MRAVDTNVLVRMVTRDDAKQATRADEFVQRGAWVSHLVLAETTWVLSAVYELDADAIATALEMLLSHEALSIADPDVVRAALAHFRKKPSLGFSACLILEVARAAGHVPMGTFDRELGKLAGAQRL
jgi:predicted nucleic-acid-binding protein